MVASDHRSPLRVLLLLGGLTIAGCAHHPAERVMEPPLDDPLLLSFEEQRQTIMHLLEVLSQKEALIQQLRADQKSQVEELKESSSQVARAEVKLRRLATEADVASQLAEVEVGLEMLRATLGAAHKASLQLLAQQLLEMATASFRQAEYSVASDLAAQAEQLIVMLMDNQSVSETPFKVAIPLKIKVDSQLQRQPSNHAAVLEVLQKMTPVVARAYQGRWLHVETEVGGSGWLMAERVEVP